MSKLFLFAIIFFGVSVSFAQITVTGSSIAPEGVSWIYRADVGNTPVQIPPGGPNQNWVIPTYSFGYSFQSDFESPSSAPHSANFPTATHCANTAGNYAYLQLSNNEFRQLGAGSGTNILNYNPTSLIMPVPLTYPHDPWTRVFQYSLTIIPGFTSTVRDSSTIIVDGWGTITTQFGTFNVLRTLERHWITESLNGTVTANKKSVSYAWFDERGITILSYTNASDSTNFTTASIVAADFSSTSIGQETQTNLDKYNLSQNYPNPFNPTTTINYSLPNSSFVKLVVYNSIGQEIATLVNETIAAGNHNVEFDASNLPSGIYFYKLQAGSFVETKKMILLK
jgi:hypothetical protein